MTSDRKEQLADIHSSQATEFTLEDRITQRLKAYQRQLASLQVDHEEL